MMKKRVAVIFAVLLVCGFSEIVPAKEAIDLVEDIPTVQAFTDEAVKPSGIHRRNL